PLLADGRPRDRLLPDQWHGLGGPLRGPTGGQGTTPGRVPPLGGARGPAVRRGAALRPPAGRSGRARRAEARPSTDRGRAESTSGSAPDSQASAAHSAVAELPRPPRPGRERSADRVFREV